MTQTITISVAKDFSKTPGGRSRVDGDFSGEAFAEDVLWPKLLSSEVVVVDLSGTLGFGSSFLEEAFGGLVRRHGSEMRDLTSRIRLVPTSSVYAKEARQYLDAALNA